MRKDFFFMNLKYLLNGEVKLGFLEEIPFQNEKNDYISVLD